MPRLVLLAAVLPLAIAAAPPPPAADMGAGCTNHGVDLATTPPRPGGVQRLDRLPPAKEILTVIHSIDGCQKPVVVRDNIGGNPAAH